MLLPGKYGNPPPCLCRFDYFCSPEEIEGHLPEQGINGIFNHPREPGPKGIVVEMGDSKILLNDILEFRDSRVSMISFIGINLFDRVLV